MQITTFNPLIVSKESEAVIKLLEDLGFEKRHKKELENNEADITSIRMKDANGFHVDVAQAPVPRDMIVIRMNVDDFEAAKAILVKHGFVNQNAGQTVETGSSYSEFMVSPSGFAINLVKHIRKEDR